MENYVKNVASSYGRDSGAMMDEMLKLNGCESVAELQEKVANGESIIEAADTAWNAGIQKQHYAAYDAMIAARNAAIQGANNLQRFREMENSMSQYEYEMRQYSLPRIGVISPLDSFGAGLNFNIVENVNDSKDSASTISITSYDKNQEAYGFFVNIVDVPEKFSINAKNAEEALEKITGKTIIRMESFNKNTIAHENMVVKNDKIYALNAPQGFGNINRVW